MAYILLVDSNDVAKRAMHGILGRGSHRLATVDTEQEAWDFLRRVTKVDLVFVDLKLAAGTGLGLVQLLKANCFLKFVPVVVYADHGDRECVKRALELRVQNFLVKPYRDTEIFSEIKKATTNPWRNRHFEEENSFCKLMGFTPAQLHQMLTHLRDSLEASLPLLKHDASLEATKALGEKLTALAEEAEAAGAWGVVDCLNQLGTYAESENWSAFVSNLEQLTLAGRLIFQHLNPNLVPPEFLTTQELDAQNEKQERDLWANAISEQRCPVVNWARLKRELDALPGCPVIDSTAAAFQMATSARPPCMSHLMDLVENDPSLAAQVLIAANQLKRSEETDPTPLEDPRLAVGRLGELRLSSQASGLVTVDERRMNVPPLLDWPKYWKFQSGVSRMVRYTCRYLELHSLESTASTAGLLHDLGKLLLLRLHPFGFQTIIDHARQHQVPLREAEKLFLGCTTADMAVHFATHHGLPQRYVNVMRWIDTPAEATEDAELVAVVSLARDLCRQNNVGSNGDVRRDRAVPLERTAEWRILSGSVFPSFNLRKFELQVHTDCRELKLELHGRLNTLAVA